MYVEPCDARELQLYKLAIAGCTDWPRIVPTRSGRGHLPLSEVFNRDTAIELLACCMSKVFSPLISTFALKTLRHVPRL